MSDGKKTTEDSHMMEAALTDQNLSPAEALLLKRWRKERKVVVPAAVRDTLARGFRGEARYNEQMSRHTYVRIGGAADVFLQASNRADILLALQLAAQHDVPLHIHGTGANTLVRDGGIRGIVLSPYDLMKDFKVVAESPEWVDVRAEAGLSFSRLVQFAKDVPSLALAPFVGIPGSVGGLVAMNAGVPEAEIQSLVREIEVITKDGEEITLGREKLKFEYRKLLIARTTIIAAATLRLPRDAQDRAQVETKTQEFQKRRVDRQPLNFPSLGSTFKNPPQEKGLPPVTAGQLIDEAGLKGVRVGGARISTKHGNFIVNEGEATARDVLALVDMARDRVAMMTGVELETEIKIIGEDA